MTLAAAIVAAMALLAAGFSAGDTALARARNLVPGLGDATVATSARALWERDGYGTAGAAMIREHPWSGVGIGMFHTLVHDYAAVGGHAGLGPDNAQSWYRHQLAELLRLPASTWRVLVQAGEDING